MENLFSTTPPVPKPVGNLIQESSDPVFEFTELSHSAAYSLIGDNEEYVRFYDYIRPKFDSFYLTVPSKSRTYHLTAVEDGFVVVCENKSRRRYLLAFRPSREVGVQLQTLMCPQDKTGVYINDPSDQVTEAIAAGVIQLLVFLNMPKMSESEFLPADSRVNARRVRAGKIALSDKTIVRPHASKARYFEYVRDCAANDDSVPEKWWGGFWNFMWHKDEESQHAWGPKHVVPHWIEGRVPTHKRAQYLVKGRKKVDPEARARQLAERRLAKQEATDAASVV